MEQTDVASLIVDCLLISMAAYKEDPAQFLEDKELGFCNIQKLGPEDDKHINGRVCGVYGRYVFAQKKYGNEMAFFFAIRGSSNINDWGQNAKVLSEGGMHIGWRQRANELKTYILNLIRRIVDDDEISATVMLTGHSLGGAVAQCLLYMLFEEISYPKAQAVTFSAPTPFQQTLANRINTSNMKERFTNIYFQDDIVPSVVPVLDNLLPVGASGNIGLASKFLKASKLMKYDQVGLNLTLPTELDPIECHLLDDNYFSQVLSALGRGHCEHCSGLDGMQCQCTNGCEPSENSRCAGHTSHCEHCRGLYGTPCDCANGCETNEHSQCVATHYGFRCDACMEFPITGPRFRCASRSCLDYDLCTWCFLQFPHEHTEFDMYQCIGSPLERVHAPTGGTGHCMHCKGIEGIPCHCTDFCFCPGISGCIAIHFNIICDSCKRTITGTRYKCAQCEDFDLCEPCLQGTENSEGHSPNHQFLQIGRTIRSV